MASYTNNKIKNPKLFKIALKISSVTAVASFLTLFVGAVNNNKLATVKDDSGNEARVFLTNDYDENLKRLKDDKNLKIGENDVISFSETENEIICYIDRAVQFDVLVDGKQLRVESKPKVTVEEALNNVLGESDEIDIKSSEVGEWQAVPRSTKVLPNMNVKVKRVVFEEKDEDVTIPYAITEEKDDKIERGNKVIVVKGQKGISRRRLRDKYIDGVKVSSEVVKEEIVEKPVNEVVKIGTKISSDVSKEFGVAFGNLNSLLGRKRNRFVGTGLAVEQSKVDEFYKAYEKAKRKGRLAGFATHYNKGRGTASGRPLKPFETAAGNPAAIPYGAVVLVVDAKTGEVMFKGIMADRCQSSVTGKSGVVIDLYGPFKFGKRAVTVLYYMP